MNKKYLAIGLLVAGLSGIGAGSKINYNIEREISQTKRRYAQVGRAYEIERMGVAVRRIDTLTPEFAEETRRLIDELDKIKSAPDFESSKRYYDEVTGDTLQKYRNRRTLSASFGLGGLFTALASCLYLGKRREPSKEKLETTTS